MPDKVPNSTYGFNSRFVDNIKDSWIDRAYEKSHSVVHVYNNEKKNIVLGYLLKIPRVSQGIGFCFTAIIWNDNNYNIRFYLLNIMQVYIEIEYAIYHLHYKKTLGLQNPHTTIRLEG